MRESCEPVAAWVGALRVCGAVWGWRDMCVCVVYGDIELWLRCMGPVADTGDDDDDDNDDDDEHSYFRASYFCARRICLYTF